MVMTPHSGRPSSFQRKRLLELVRANYAHLTGRLTAAGNARRRRKWIEIAHELNFVRDSNGVVRVIKSPDQWKRCWTDIRLKTKSKLDKTDVEFTSDDEAVIEICGPITEEDEQSEDDGGGEKIEMGDVRQATFTPPQNDIRTTPYTPSTSDPCSLKQAQYQLPTTLMTASTFIPFTNYTSTAKPQSSQADIKHEEIHDSPDASRITDSPVPFANPNTLNESLELQREMVVNLRTILNMLEKLIDKTETISKTDSNPISIQSTSASHSDEKKDQSKSESVKKRLSKFDFYHMWQDVLKTTNTKEMSEYDFVGQNVAKKLQRMEPNQALYAESVINLALKGGLLKSLTENTELCERKNFADHI